MLRLFLCTHSKIQNVPVSWDQKLWHPTNTMMHDFPSVARRPAAPTISFIHIICKASVFLLSSHVSRIRSLIYLGMTTAFRRTFCTTRRLSGPNPVFHLQALSNARETSRASSLSKLPRIAHSPSLQLLESEASLAPLPSIAKKNGRAVHADVRAPDSLQSIKPTTDSVKLQTTSSLTETRQQALGYTHEQHRRILGEHDKLLNQHIKILRQLQQKQESSERVKEFCFITLTVLLSIVVIKIVTGDTWTKTNEKRQEAMPPSHVSSKATTNPDSVRPGPHRDPQDKASSPQKDTKQSEATISAPHYKLRSDSPRNYGWFW